MNVQNSGVILDAIYNKVMRKPTKNKLFVKMFSISTQIPEASYHNCIFNQSEKQNELQRHE